MRTHASVSRPLRAAFLPRLVRARTALADSWVGSTPDCGIHRTTNRHATRATGTNATPVPARAGGHLRRRAAAGADHTARLHVHRTLKDRRDYTERTFSDIYKQLADHPTRHGHAVRLAWAADPTDPDASAVVTALSQGYQQLSATRQEMVRSFLARKIDAARADASADGISDWKDQLSSAFWTTETG